MSLWTATYHTGRDVYAVPFIATGQVIKSDGTTETYNSSSHADYAVSFTGYGAHYLAGVPDTLPQGVQIDVVFYERLGGSPSSTDTLLGGDLSGTYDGSTWTNVGGSSDLYAITAQLDQIQSALASADIEFVGPHVDGDDIELVSGDDYRDGRLSWSTDLDLSNKTITFTLVSQLGGQPIEFPGTFASGAIKVDLTSSETSALKAGRYAYKYQLTYGEYVTTLKIGRLSVIDGI
jgi:hypothetical protein